ncbi:plastocyanin/azurin family copper-binding protein [Nocardia sp. alder85J]|uniref:plastocyanin/azurin family copper-binding protein n=1 Tax=Nocardia sp. alder85J TaxID=2862949 RepID=UPI001CD62DDF|nr:plastocyanin/azurin family copper-binding protein [Nocardia sp. alder85J]MCX4097175.1 plastocyanin/azurin family copper-binding protein [Nocardia sp. alder85J]
MIFGTRHRLTGPGGFAAALCAFALATSGCGSSTTSSTPPPTTIASPPTTASAPASTPTPHASTITVDVKDMKFSPATLTVTPGDTVTWKFADRMPHAVQGMGDTAMGINSPIYNKGEWSYTFSVPGTYRYLCPLHPDMRGTVTVQ